MRQKYGFYPMCRMIAEVGKFDAASIASAVAMSQGRTASHEYPDRRHFDGWGAVYLDAHEQLRCVRDEAPISNDRAHAKLNEARGRLLVIHARAASVKSKTGIDYVHPVQGAIAGRTAYFFHNRYAPDIFRELGYKNSSWDSRELFEWLVPAFEAGDRQAALRERLESLPINTTSANFMLVEPTRLTICNWFMESSPSPKYFTMHLARTAEALIIASDPIIELAPAAQWEAIKNRTIMAFGI
jgi:predicted glutamine amidotransferase